MIELTSEDCLQLLLRGANEMRRGNLAVADNLFSAVILAARALPKEQAYAIFPIATADLSLLRSRQGKTAEAAKLRVLAITTVDVISQPPEHAGYLSLLADALLDLGEYRRAIPFYEAAAQRISNSGDSLNTAALLSRAGRCYMRAGLHAQAAVQLRASLDLFRQHSAYPHIPEVLINLGNALRKTAPAEAEAVYTEAATWYESRLQLESAAPAWVNLGILCSENNRHDEALAWYRKALAVREPSPRATPLNLASLYNNIANCYRRMGNIGEAHKQITRAIDILESAAPQGLQDRLVASAYHSRALIFGAEGRDLEALEWFRKADAYRQNLPNPSLEETATDLTELIAVLDRLRRTMKPPQLASASKKSAPPRPKPQPLTSTSAGLNPNPKAPSSLRSTAPPPPAPTSTIRSPHWATASASKCPSPKLDNTLA
jgi:tetratricopeptide (TPR) repeat protein